MTQRDLDDAFVDTFLLEGVPPIRTQMPFNLLDPGTNLAAGLRVDTFDAVAAGGPYATLEAVLAAFYAEQAVFNADPSRNRITMRGAIRETFADDGTVLVSLDIAYQDLPLTVYTGDSFNDALFVQFDPAQVVTLLDGGFLEGRLRLEMTIPFPGAPLHFWDAAITGAVRRIDFVGYGSGEMLDAAGVRIGRGAVRVRSQCGGAATCPPEADRVELTPIGDGASK